MENQINQVNIWDVLSSLATLAGVLTALGIAIIPSVIDRYRKKDIGNYKIFISIYELIKITHTRGKWDTLHLHLGGDNHCFSVVMGDEADKTILKDLENYIDIIIDNSKYYNRIERNRMKNFCYEAKLLFKVEVSPVNRWCELYNLMLEILNIVINEKRDFTDDYLLNNPFRQYV